MTIGRGNDSNLGFLQLAAAYSLAKYVDEKLTQMDPKYASQVSTLLSKSGAKELFPSSLKWTQFSENIWRSPPES